jgi:hypothetical protein
MQCSVRAHPAGQCVYVCLERAEECMIRSPQDDHPPLSVDHADEAFHPRGLPIMDIKHVVIFQFVIFLHKLI